MKKYSKKTYANRNREQTPREEGVGMEDPGRKDSSSSRAATVTSGPLLCTPPILFLDHGSQSWSTVLIMESLQNAAKNAIFTGALTGTGLVACMKGFGVCKCGCECLSEFECKCICVLVLIFE